MSDLEHLTRTTFISMLERLQQVIEKAERFAEQRGIDSREWMTARLADDMFPFARQVQAACDHAQDTAARLSAVEPLQLDRTEELLPELRERIGKSIRFMQALPAVPANDDGSRAICRPLPNNRELRMPATDYVRAWALPQFYFHLVTAYDILRSRGVDIGKRDYLTDVWSAVRQCDG